MSSEPARGKRRLMDPAERRRQVLDAARNVFLERGYGGASMRAIASEAGVNEALLYRTSSSKEQLFVDAVADPLEEAVSRTTELSLAPEPPASGDENLRERSTLFIRDLLDAMREIAPLLNAVLMADRETGGNFYATRIEPAIASIRDVVVSNLALWEHREFDPEVVVRAIYGMCWFFAIDERYGDGVGKSSDELAPVLLGLIFEGLVARDDNP